MNGSVSPVTWDYFKSSNRSLGVTNPALRENAFSFHRTSPFLHESIHVLGNSKT
jgi:hypothetical protein